MTESQFAVIAPDGVTVENVIVADQEFIDTLKAGISDEKVDTGDYTTKHKFEDVTDLDPRPGPGWTLSKDGQFSPPEPTQDELDALAETEAATQAREEDDAFLHAMRAKIQKKQSLTQDEQVRLQLIDVSRR